MELSDGKSIGKNVFSKLVSLLFEVGSHLKTLLFYDVLILGIAGVVETIFVHPAEAAHDRIFIRAAWGSNEETQLAHIVCRDLS